MASALQQVGLSHANPYVSDPTRALVAPNDRGFFIQDVIDLVSATLLRATLGSRIKTGIASPFKLRLTMQIASEEPMRTLVSIIAFSLIVAVAAPAFAGAPKTEAACKKAGMQWDATAKKCSKGM